MTTQVSDWINFTHCLLLFNRSLQMYPIEDASLPLAS